VFLFPAWRRRATCASCRGSPSRRRSGRRGWPSPPRRLCGRCRMTCTRRTCLTGRRSPPRPACGRTATTSTRPSRTQSSTSTSRRTSGTSTGRSTGRSAPRSRCAGEKGPPHARDTGRAETRRAGPGTDRRRQGQMSMLKQVDTCVVPVPSVFLLDRACPLGWATWRQGRDPLCPAVYMDRGGR
jgi:hypothetical protein